MYEILLTYLWSLRVHINEAFWLAGVCFYDNMLIIIYEYKWVRSSARDSDRLVEWSYA